MEGVVGRSNMRLALKWVEQNRGSADIDGLTVAELNDWLKAHWPRVKPALLAGEYTLQPVCRVDIPKRQGGPLSPLLSNILLTDLDREREKRGLAFCRYADDCNICVRSARRDSASWPVSGRFSRAS